MEIKGNSEYLDLMGKNPFPNENINPKIKEGSPFGLKVAKHIYYSHLYTESIYFRSAKIIENRKYATGSQDPNLYKPMLDAQIDNMGDDTWINISWEVSSPAYKFVNVVLGDLMNQDYKIEFNAVDVNSRTKKQKARDDFFGKMVKRKIMQQLEEETGVVIENKNEYVPEDEEELEIYMDMSFKLSIEIAMEQLVSAIFESNDWHNIKKRVIRDLIENNKGAIRLYFDENDSIRIRYVDIAGLITSYTDHPDYNDCEYEGEVYKITIRELRRRSKGKLSEEDLFAIARKNAGRNSNPQWEYDNTFSHANYTNNLYSYDDYRVPILDFVYYTTDVYNWAEKKKSDGRVFFDKKSYNYEKPERSKHEINVIKKQIENQYTGLWVIGTEYMGCYGREKNIIRNKTNGKLHPTCFHKYIIFEPNLRGGTSKSMVDVMKPDLDGIQIATLKMRHFIASSLPPGMDIDINAINNISLGVKEYSPLTLLKLLAQKGHMIYSRTDDNGDYVNGKPVEFNQRGLADGLMPFISSIQYYLQNIRDNTGVNEARDASKPDNKALVGIQKLSLLASNNSTRELYDAFVSGIYRKSGQVIALMLQELAEFKGLDKYEGVIGDAGIKMIEFSKDIPLVELGIRVEALPSELDLQRLEGYIQLSLQTGEIRIEDAMIVNRMMNTKKAEQYLKFRRRKYKEELMAEMAEKERITMEREKGAAMASAEAQKVKYQAEVEKETALKQVELEYQKQLDDHKTNNEIILIKEKGNVELAKIKEAANQNLINTTLTKEQPQPRVFPKETTKVSGGL